MKILNNILILLALLGLTQQVCHQYIGLNGFDYERQSAEEKFEKVSELIEQTKDHYGRYPPCIEYSDEALGLQDNSFTLEFVGEEIPIHTVNRPTNTRLPKTNGDELERRWKLVHSLGVTAYIEYESVGDHEYTGIFKGASYGIARYSTTHQYRDVTPQIHPSFAFKFFRDGTPSANLFAAGNPAGQTTTNIFKHDMSNFKPSINQDASYEDINIRNTLLNVTDFPSIVGVSDAALFDEEGEQEEDVKFPFRLVFHPSEEVRDQIPDDLELNDHYFLEQLGNLDFEVLYDVYAYETPSSKEPELIGRIKGKSQFQTSYFGDYSFFFKHQKYEEDLERRPEWREQIEDILEEQANIYPQYTFPDIQN